MRRALKITFDGIKVFLLFTSCTILFYFAILWINEEYESYHRYEKPKEETVEKVSGNEEEPAKDAFVNRMMFFYENGE
ncbi:YqzK family protein [Bacillus cereus]|uniref:YqzK family protein n=1 Tax=Bacillus cereus TaxID=1396 RepID=UPI0025A05C72|nr:YqzK family protein [Bacillus cereus]MDM5235793.1 YqzK family protein [Bacillus cereus]